MPKDAIDSMIEGWASGPSAPPTPKPPVEKAAVVEETPSGTPLDAATAIRQALLKNTGRRKHVKTWASEARKVLGLSRLTPKRYGEVLAAGFSAGLFQLDETSLSFPILVATEPALEEEPEGEPPSMELLEAAGDLAESDLKSRSFIREEEGAHHPEFTPPSHLACGHWDLQSVPDPTAPEPPAEDYQRKVQTISVSVESPESCPSCAARKPGDPRYQEGEYRKPVPLASRRTPEKSARSYPGFPGLCTDPETGFYIGGIANDCSKYHPGKERCVFHVPKSPKEVNDV